MLVVQTGHGGPVVNQLHLLLQVYLDHEKPFVGQKQLVTCLEEGEGLNNRAMEHLGYMGPV